MHTPRFSGQPISAGDLVFVVIPSLPIQTSCTHSRHARRQQRESTQTGSKVYCESGETSKKLRTHSKRENYAPGFDSERLTRLFGAGAPFRPLFCPIPSFLFRDRRIPIKPTIPRLP